MKMTLLNAAKQALEALEMYCEHGAILRPIHTAEALRAAIEAEEAAAPRITDKE